MSASDPDQVFLQEAQDLLEQLEQCLLDLESTPRDGELIDTAFRALHTIKGSGAMFGFDAVAAFTHHVETAFDLVRKGQVIPTGELIAVALAAKDHMRLLIDQPANARASAGDAILEDLQRFMEAAMGSAPRADGDVAEMERTVWRIRFRLPADAMATGTNPLLLLDELRALGDASVTALTGGVPSLEAIDPGLSYLSWDVMLRTDQGRAAIEEVFLFVIDDMELDIEQIVDEAIPATVAQPTPAPAARQNPDSETRETKSVDTIRVPAERLDELMDRVGQLVIAQSRLKEIAAASTSCRKRRAWRDPRSHDRRSCG
jgi:two-component system chemotaxis sensor kinase CheA